MKIFNWQVGAVNFWCVLDTGEVSGIYASKKGTIADISLADPASNTLKLSAANGILLFLQSALQNEYVPSAIEFIAYAKQENDD